VAKIITLTIFTDVEHAGEVELDLDGYKGKGCHAVQERFTRDTGSTVIEDRRKPEYNAPVTKTVCIER
jgi:hypothetical protein